MLDIGDMSWVDSFTATQRQIKAVVSGTATPSVTAHLAVQAAMLAPVQTKSSQYKDKLIVLADRQNAAPAYLRRLVRTACQEFVAVVMVLLACRPLASTILVHGKQENPGIIGRDTDIMRCTT